MLLAKSSLPADRAEARAGFARMAKRLAPPFTPPSTQSPSFTCCRACRGESPVAEPMVTDSHRLMKVEQMRDGMGPPPSSAPPNLYPKRARRMNHGVSVCFHGSMMDHDITFLLMCT